MEENKKTNEQAGEQDVVIIDEEGNPVKESDQKAKDPEVFEKTETTDTTPVTETVINQEETEDVVIEDENGDGPDAIKKLREKLALCVKEKQEYLDGWQRAKAEFINSRKRDQEANEHYLKFAKEDLILQLIPVLDSFEMAFANKEAWEKVDKNWRIGVEHIHSQLVSVLKNNNVEQINPIGEKFDPSRDDAVEHEPVTEARFENLITKVIQKGYKLNGKIIKATKVRVGEFKK